MIIKKLWTVALVIIFVLQIPVALARPLTDYSLENKNEIKKQFDLTLKNFPELIVPGEDIYADSYPTFLYLKNNNILSSEIIQKAETIVTRNDFAELFTAFFEVENKKAISRKNPSFKNKNALFYAVKHNVLEIRRQGAVEPLKEITIIELNQGLKNVSLPFFQKKKEKILFSDLLSHLVSAYLQKSHTYPDFLQHTPQIELINQDFVVDGEKVSGLFVNWLIIEDPFLTEDIIRKEIKKMKQMGIIGINTEVGWKFLMPKPSVFFIPEHFETFLNIAQEEGMYINLLLSAHYTPDWLFEKYDQDIRMVDVHGNAIDEGEYITFSFASPAVNDQIDFIERSIDHFSHYNNILSFLLSNEISYGRLHDLDYSHWMEVSFQNWLQENNKPKQKIPRSNSSSSFKDWKRFRQITLNDYLNTLYYAAKKRVPRNIPISHKLIPYENTSHYAPSYGLHISPKEIEMDFIAFDIYGVTPNTFSFFYSFPDKPLMITEAGMPGHWDSESMYEFLLLNYMHGARIQGIFQWNCGTHANVMFYCDGNLWEKTYGIQKAIHFFSGQQFFPQRKTNAALILPTNAINLFGKDFENYQYVFDSQVLNLYKKTGNYPMILWADDISPSHKNEELYTDNELSHIQFINFLETPVDSISQGEFLKKFETNETLWKRK